ncbi:hypothetical protein N7470_006588 [Penicillium chermesinum]|nr:hypothetical protein N7470_006588 [Penicillium chermesinum]
MAPGVARRQFPRQLTPRWKYPHTLPKRIALSRQIQLPRDTLELDIDTPGLLGTCTSLHFACLKAAWVLTLQCFQPADVIHFSYEPDNDCPIVYTVRVDPSWDVQTLLQLIESADVSEKRDAQLYGVYASPSPLLEAHVLHFCTILTAPRLDRKWPVTKETTQSKSSTDLTLTRNGNQIRASLKKKTLPPHENPDSIIWTFRHVLKQITTQRETLLLKDIDYCSSWDRKLLRVLTRTKSITNNVCLHDLILSNCREYPSRMAVRSFDGDLTYKELDDLSFRLAIHLRGLGVGPETFVLSSFQKSTWAIVARLAILRAGGAYISIHASNPPAYLSSVIERTNAKVMLSDPAFADQFYHCIDTVWLQTLPMSSEHKLPSIEPSNACTVLFTSGSTGKPKAIVQEHRSYASAIRDYSRNLGLTEETRYLHFDDYAFDISNLEFLVPLILGGCCCVPGPMKTVQDLTENIQTLAANIAFLTPTVAIKLNPAAVPNLKILCVGGEPLPKDLLNNWAGSSTRLINQFGMGEAAVCCAYNDSVHEPGTPVATIGKPSSGAIWIADPTYPEKLMPVGAVGEILHPDRSGARLCRSGDLARWLPSGRIEYIGRKDTIVKLDGCRIDVIEVEHLARKCLTPKDAIVVDLLGVIDGREDPCLAAFLYLSDHPNNSEAVDVRLTDSSEDSLATAKVRQIREVLAEFLPLYMIPTLFLLATRVPRTASNKTDRRMIRMLGQQYHASERERRSQHGPRAEAQLLPP